MKEEFKSEVVREQMREEQKELLDHLNSWIGRTNAENAFVSFSALLMLRWGMEQLKEETVLTQPALVEFAAFHLYPHFGNTRETNLAAVASIRDLLRRLKEGDTFEGLAPEDDGIDAKVAEIARHVRGYLKDVRGTDYITQMQERIECVSGRFEDWFRERTQIGPKRAIELLYAIQRQLTDNLNAMRKAASRDLSVCHAQLPKTLDDAHKDQGERSESIKSLAFLAAITGSAIKFLPVSRDQIVSLRDPPTSEEWAGLIDLIGMTTDARKNMENPICVKSRPLFVLPDGRLFFVNLACVFSELFFACERTAKSDAQFSSGQYHTNQKEWMEGNVGDFMKRIFPAERVFVEADYPNPDKPGDTTEIDCIVEWGPFLVLIEAKGKQFRLFEALSRLGRLTADLRANVQEAFEQADRAMRYVNLHATAVFVERKTKRKLQISRERLRRIFKISVTLHDLADFTTQLANLKPLDLFSTGDYPFAVSLADLDTITRFCEGPDVFLHYVERRLNLQRSEKNIIGHELNLFGTYLKTRLQPSLFWERKTEDGAPFTMMLIGAGCEVFDAWLDAQLGVRDDTPEIRLVLPPLVKAVLVELRSREDDGARWIAFALLNLSRKAVDRLEALLDQVRDQQIERGKMRSSIFVDESLVGIITAGNTVETENLQKLLFVRSSVEKYRHKANSSFGLAIQLNDPSKPFSFALWGEGEWEYDPRMEATMKMMSTLQSQSGQ